MKKRICTMMAVILFCQLFFLPLSASEAAADTRVTVTFAAGGVACGVYFFLRLTFGSSMAIQPYQSDANALFNHGPEGWQINSPSLRFSSNEHLRMSAEQSTETTSMEILKLDRKS